MNKAPNITSNFSTGEVPAKAFEPAEKAFDPVATPIYNLVVFPGVDAIAFWVAQRRETPVPV
jgi:hypothetical protein